MRTEVQYLILALVLYRSLTVLYFRRMHGTSVIAVILHVLGFPYTNFVHPEGPSQAYLWTPIVHGHTSSNPFFHHCILKERTAKGQSYSI